MAATATSSRPIAWPICSKERCLEALAAKRVEQYLGRRWARVVCNSRISLAVCKEEGKSTSSVERPAMVEVLLDESAKGFYRNLEIDGSDRLCEGASTVI